MTTTKTLLCFCLLAVAVAVSSCCQESCRKTSDNPHSFITDPSKAEMITSLEEIDSERFYLLDYTADYKLDKLIEAEVESTEQMFEFLSKNIFDAVPNDLAIPSMSAGCSAYAATEISRGDFLMGRNYDYCHVENGVEVPATALFLRTSPEGGKKSISMVDAYWLGFHKGFYHDGKTDLSMLMGAPFNILDGMNEDGFAVCVLHLDGTPTRQNEPGKPLIWASVFMRKLLDTAGSVEEAIALAKSYNLSMKTPANGNLHFFVADAAGDFAILEYSYEEGADTDTAIPNVLRVLRGEDCDRYVTNFYVDPALANHPKLGPLGKHGLWRYDTLKVNLAKYGYKVDEGQAMGLLKAVSQDPHPGETTSHTQWSAVYNLSQRKVDISLLQEYDKQYSFSIE